MVSEKTEKLEIENLSLAKKTTIPVVSSVPWILLPALVFFAAFERIFHHLAPLPSIITRYQTCLRTTYEHQTLVYRFELLKSDKSVSKVMTEAQKYLFNSRFT